MEKAENIPFLLLLKTGQTSYTHSDLPCCPHCHSLLRPGVVWFGEKLEADAPYSIDEWIEQESVELVVVVGTSLEVYPAAEWVAATREDGAALAVFELNNGRHLVQEWYKGDWLFEGDAAVLLPRIQEIISLPLVSHPQGAPSS